MTVTEVLSSSEPAETNEPFIPGPDTEVDLHPPQDVAAGKKYKQIGPTGRPTGETFTARRALLPGSSEPEIIGVKNLTPKVKRRPGRRTPQKLFRTFTEASLPKGDKED